MSDFATAFVKRFQSGQDDYPKYPSNVLFRIIDHFIVRKDDLTEASEVSTNDMAIFCNRFGSLPQAVTLIAENFLDPHGEVHMWYHFNLPGHVLDRKLLTEKNHAWLLRDSGSKQGDFVLVLRKAQGGKKEILIEHVKDKDTGKMKYGTKTSVDEERAVSPSGKGGKSIELRLFTGSLLEYLKERTAAFTPVCSQLFLGTHPDFSGVDDLKSTSKQSSAAKKSDDEDHIAPSQLSDDRHMGYKVKPETEISFMSYSDWAQLRGERFKAANNRYKNWQTAAQGATTTSGTTGAQKSQATSLTKYVAGLQLMGFADK